MRHKIISTPPIDPGRIFAVDLEDKGPGARASLISLAIHTAIVAVVITLLAASTSFVPRAPRVVMLQESKLLDPVLPVVQSGAQSGSLSSSRQQTRPARGIMPPSTKVRAPFASLRIPSVQPRLAVSPSLLAPSPPPIEPNLHYGDPNSGIQFLSAGWGSSGGIGTGPGFNGGNSNSNLAGKTGNLEHGGMVFSVSDVSVIPVLIYKVDPEYTEQAKLSKYQGTVLLDLVIDKEGHPQQIRVARSLGLGLDEKAVEAVRHWRFRPGIKDGETVDVAANVEVNFQLF